MSHFKVVAGSHTEDGETYRKGQVFESENPLDEMFANKVVHATEPEVKAFKKQEAAKKAKPPGQVDNIEDIEADNANARAIREAKAARAAAGEDEEEGEEGEGGDVLSTLGNDVTSDFDGADKVGVKVYKKGKLFSIAKEDDPDRAVRNGKSLTRGQARAYIEEHTPEEPPSDEE